MSQRVDSLRQLLSQDPSNSRYRYMLAMELSGSGDLDGAASVFQELLAADPTYVAAYFHYGQTLERLGLTGQARQVYQRGIDAASQAGDSHARSELQAALDMLA